MNGQAWNRYSYVINNPLALTDTNGYCFLHLCGLFKRFPILGSLFEIAAAAVCLPLGGGLPCAAVAASLSSGFVAGVTSGSLSAAIRAGVNAFDTAVAFYAVGSFTDVIAGYPIGSHITVGLDKPDAFAFNIAGHALVGCASAVASGGKCGPAALAGGITSAAGPFIDGRGFAFGLVANTVLGGLASVAGGGKFANGAVTGAFGYLFNRCANDNHCTDEEIFGGKAGGAEASSFLEDTALLLTGVGSLVRFAAERAAIALVADGVEFGTVLADGTVAGASALGAAPNLVRLGQKFGLNADSAVARNILENLNMTVSQFISENRAASILRKFPTEYLDKTLAQALSEGGNTVRKLHTDGRFIK
jgi:hypothetical protein